MGVSIAQVLASISGLCTLLGIVGQVSAEPIKPHPCGLGLVERINPKSSIHNASKASSQVPPGNVRVTFVDHSTFQIETPQGISAATDYAGLHIPGRVPTIVTMNNSHSSHHTDFVDPAVKHILRGWHPEAGIARHNLRVKDLRVYNLPTNIFDFGQGATNSNSVFIFEAVGLCFAHLGHLHHFLSQEQITQLGRIDVLFVPIDGTVTLSHEEAMHIIGQISPRVVMPMHMSFAGADKFPEIAASSHKVKYLGTNTMLINRSILPGKTEIWFLVNEL